MSERIKASHLEGDEITGLIVDAANLHYQRQGVIATSYQLASAIRQFTLYCNEHGYQIDRGLLKKVKPTKKNPLELDPTAQSVFDLARIELFPPLPVLPRAVSIGAPDQGLQSRQTRSR